MAADSRPDGGASFIYYSGHGRNGDQRTKLGGEEGGAWVVGTGVELDDLLDGVAAPETFVTFKEIQEAWDAGCGDPRGRRLVITCHQCHIKKLIGKAELFDIQAEQRRSVRGHAIARIQVHSCPNTDAVTLAKQIESGITMAKVYASSCGYIRYVK